MANKKETSELSDEKSTFKLKIDKLTLEVRLQWIDELIRLFLSIPGELLRMLLSVIKKSRDRD